MLITRLRASISSENELNIHSYYQVLEFSPQNRDLYFKKQITNESKLRVYDFNGAKLRNKAISLDTC